MKTTYEVQTYIPNIDEWWSRQSHADYITAYRHYRRIAKGKVRIIRIETHEFNMIEKDNEENK